MIILTTALWLGILTSISPCPLATNIAAVSYLAKRIAHPKSVLWSGLAYTFGRMLAYAVLGAVIIASLASVPAIANFLQKYMNKALGPILLLAGLFLLNIIKFNFPGLSFSTEKQNTLAQAGVKGAFALGVIFALSFCPISAALFFGSLIPLALGRNFGIALPFLYGIGTGLPVIIFAVAIALGVISFSRWFKSLSTIELYTRRITGIIFVSVGIYYIWSYIIKSFL